MIAPINTDFQLIACVRSTCDKQSAAGMSTTAHQRPEKSDQIRISDQAREQQKSSKTDTAVIKDEKNLSEEDKREVEKLKKRDREVKDHERAHMAAGAGANRFRLNRFIPSNVASGCVALHSTALRGGEEIQYV